MSMEVKFISSTLITNNFKSLLFIFSVIFKGAEFLIFADALNAALMTFRPDDHGSLTQLPISNKLLRPVALAYDPLDNRVYWTDVTLQVISRSFLNGSSQEVLLDQRVDRPDGLAVDIIGRNLYWTDTGTNKLEVSKLDGSYRKTLIYSGLDEPRDIVLDSNKG